MKQTKKVYYTIEEAASMLSLDPDALRARCRRASRLVDGKTIAELGGGIYAIKFGSTWRVHIPQPPSSPSAEPPTP